MTSLDHYLASLPERCAAGWHHAMQGCPECPVDEPTPEPEGS